MRRLLREVAAPFCVGLGGACFAVPLIWPLRPGWLPVMVVLGAACLVLADRWRWTTKRAPVSIRLPSRVQGVKRVIS